MMQHYDIDGLVEYGTQPVPGSLTVVNGQWRDLDKEVRKGRQTERKLQADPAEQTAREGSEIHKKAGTVEALQAVQADIAKLRADRGAQESDDRQPAQRSAANPVAAPEQSAHRYGENDRLTHAETALVALVKPHLKKEQEARALVRELFVT
jgi:hypothetical protein